MSTAAHTQRSAVDRSSVAGIATGSSTRLHSPDGHERVRIFSNATPAQDDVVVPQSAVASPGAAPNLVTAATSTSRLASPEAPRQPTPPPPKVWVTNSTQVQPRQLDREMAYLDREEEYETEKYVLFAL